jgi:hypothetical protein
MVAHKAVTIDAQGISFRLKFRYETPVNFIALGRPVRYDRGRATGRRSFRPWKEETCQTPARHNAERREQSFRAAMTGNAFETRRL